MKIIILVILLLANVISLESRYISNDALIKILKDVLNSNPPKSFVQGGDAQGPKSFVQGGDAQGPKSFVQGGDAQGPKSFVQVGDAQGPKSFVQGGDAHGPKSFVQGGVAQGPKSFVQGGDAQGPKSFVQGGDAQGPKSFVQGGDAQGPKSFVQGGDAQGPKSFVQGGDANSKRNCITTLHQTRRQIQEISRKCSYVPRKLNAVEVKSPCSLLKFAQQTLKKMILMCRSSDAQQPKSFVQGGDSKKSCTQCGDNNDNEKPKDITINLNIF
eukprot:TCONS_00007684-protein